MVEILTYPGLELGSLQKKLEKSNEQQCKAYMTIQYLLYLNRVF